MKKFGLIFLFFGIRRYFSQTRRMKFVAAFLLNIMITAQVMAAEPQTPKIEAIGAIMIDADTCRVLWGKNEHEPMSMASTTKIMTALLTLEQAELSDIVTVSKRAAAAPEVNMNLKAGERIKLEYLMYALMLQSSNDAAVAIAEHVGGSVEEFCRRMTIRAKELGALDTVFETPNGLDAGQHHSTAYDMAMITRAALKNPEFIRISNTPSIQVNSDRASYYIGNKNRLLNEYQGANGVKTGFTGKAGHCFVGAAKRGDMQLITVVLASGWGDRGKEQKWTDTKRLLNYGFDNFKYQDIVTEGAAVKQVAVERSKTPLLTLYFDSGLRLPLTEAESKAMRIALDVPESVLSPVETGQRLGVAHVYLGHELYKDIGLVTAMGAERHDLRTSIGKIIVEWLGMASNY